MSRGLFSRAEGTHLAELQIQQDRRKAVRIAPKGTLIVTVGDHSHRARVANIGAGGCLALTTVTAPESWLERFVEISMRLDGKHSAWLKLTGRIRRIEANSIAIAFDNRPPEFVRVIDEMSTASYSHHRMLSVVLVDATEARRLAIAEAFRAAGCTVVDVSTPLEAIVRLGESHFEPDLVAVADSLPTSTSDELRRFVDKAHPAAKLVTIGDEAVEPSGLLHWLSSANPDNDLAARVRSVLTRPARR